MTDTNDGSKEVALTWKAFLESVAPGAEKQIGLLFEPVMSKFSNTKEYWQIPQTELRLHCDYDDCAGIRTFRQTTEVIRSEDKNAGHPDYRMVHFLCRNCQSRLKSFALRIRRFQADSGMGSVIKFGEIPSFGPPLPSRLVTLLRNDADLLSKGRRSENQGMGIGAFGYYRRLVENQKGHLIEEIRKVAEKSGADSQVLELYKAAAAERRFTTAVEMIKDSIPTSLLIDDQNPLMLLHGALSEGLHGLPDEECLELAHHIRVVLAELVERIDKALSDEAELKNAVQKLAQRHNDKADKPT